MRSDPELSRPRRGSAEVEPARAQAPGAGSIAALREALDGPGAERVDPRHTILYVDRGIVRVASGDAEWLLPMGRAAAIAPGEAFRPSTPGPAEWIVVHLPPELVDQSPREPPPKTRRRRHHVTATRCRVFAPTPVAREMLRFAPELGEAHPARDAYFRAIGGLLGDWSIDPLPLGLPTGRSPGLAVALRHTRERLAADPTIEEVAKLASMSIRTLARRMESEVKMGWRRYLHDARMLRAMELLTVPGTRISATARAVGFESGAAFTRAFEAFTGEKPKDFRRRFTDGADG